jgi:ABC-2 type transport system ATP-binding protein
MHAIRFSGVRKLFAESPALDDIHLDIEPGEFFGLVGVNGAGKTTLIKCLLDFCSMDAGVIEIFGVSHREPSSREPLAFLPERFTPPHYLKGGDFIDLMRRLYRAEFGDAEIESMMEALDLGRAALQKPVRQFSKGMTQKLGLAGCLLAKRRLYVLDEPMSGLDPKARALFKAKLSAMRQEGTTVFFTSHALVDVEELADRMAILHDGRLHFCGTPAELRERFAAATLEDAFLRAIA